MSKSGHADRASQKPAATRKPAIVTPSSLKKLAEHLNENRKKIAAHKLYATPMSLSNSFTMDVELPLGNTSSDETEHMRAFLAHATEQRHLYSVVHAGDFIPSGEDDKNKTTMRHFRLDVDEGKPFTISHCGTHKQLENAIEEIMKASPDELEKLAKKINEIKKTGEGKPGAHGPGWAL